MKRPLRLFFAVLLACAMLAALTVSASAGLQPLCRIGDPIPLCCVTTIPPQQVHHATCIINGQVEETFICTGPCLL